MIRTPSSMPQLRLTGMAMLAFCGVMNAQKTALSPPHRAHYAVSIDLTQCKNDQLEVLVELPKIEQDEAIYLIPRIVPGTYGVADYGKYTDGLEAFDIDGNKLLVNRLDLNRWQIKGARKLDRLKYVTDDSFDHPDSVGVFGPAGSSFDQRVYLLNMFALVGFVEGTKESRYELSIQTHDSLWASTALDRDSPLRPSEGIRVDRFTAPNYFEFHDRPLLYARADTASLKIGDTRVEVGLFAPNKSLTALDVLTECTPVLKAIGVYLGGKMPTDRYSILVYTDDPENKPEGAQHIGSYGALEHHTSTVVYMPEYPIEFLGYEFVNIVAHEFLHIVTPLNVHSREIEDFDFFQPAMSEHLWLYEGTTEYTSVLVQKREGLIDEEEFFDELTDKLESTEEFNLDLPMTVMSRHVLDIFPDEYLSVYSRGAILSMSLDLEIRWLTQGENSLRDVLSEMSRSYGPSRPFDDATLFDEISRRTHPDLRRWLALHVEGAQAPPLETQLARFGIEYKAQGTRQSLGFGDITYDYDESCDCMVVSGIENPSPLTIDLDLRIGDRLRELNGASLAPEKVRETFALFFEDLRAGSSVKFEVERPDAKGRFKIKKLKGKATVYAQSISHIFELEESPTPEALRLREQWLKN